MADTKISQLPAATTPLDGTEVLPVVQGGTTDKVSVANLTVGRVVETGLLTVKRNQSGTTTEFKIENGNAGANSDVAQIFSTANGNWTNKVGRSTGVMNWTSANGIEVFKIANAGDTTVSAGNLVIGTSGKGIDFSATPGTGTSELLADYEEGTWTPSVGGTATYFLQSGTYTKVGRLVHVTGSMVINSIGTGSATTISGLPFASIGSPADFVGFSNFSSAASSVVYLAGSANGSSQILIRSLTAAGTGVSTNNIFQNGTRVDFAGTYETT
jgi:hypothetical protein